MKLKLKIDSQQIKGFLVQHGEKFVMAGALAILAMFGLAALNRETLPVNLQATTVASRSDDATRKVNDSKPPDQLVPKLNYVADVHVWEKGIPQLALKVTNPIDIPSYLDLPKRTDPKLLPVAEVHVQPFKGALLTNAKTAVDRVTPVPHDEPKVPPGKGNPRPGGGILIPNPVAASGPQPIPPTVILPGPQSSGYGEAHYGMLVTALIPDAEQRAEYERCFAYARRAAAEAATVPGAGGRNLNRDQDSPQYVWCRLERTDTNDGSVKLMDFGDLVQVSADWTDKTNPKKHEFIAQTKISPTFYNQTVADLATWGVQVPEVADPDYVAAPWITWRLPPLALHDWGRDGVHPKVPLVGEAAPAVQAVLPGIKQAPIGFGPGQVAPVPVAPVPGRGEAPVNTAPYRMFRFVDFGVQPGHAYQYRVQMLLRNPNFGLDPQLLVNPDPQAPLYRETPWSEKSAAAALAPDTRLIGGEVERRKHAEPRAINLGVLQWNTEFALDLLFQRKATELGEVFNFVGKEAALKDVMDAVTGTIHDVDAEFLTQAALIDVRGNEEKLPGADSLSDASEELLLTGVDDLKHPEQMRLVVVNQALDELAVKEWEATHKPPAGAVKPPPGRGPLGLPGVVPPAGPVKPPVNQFGNPPKIGPHRPANKNP